MRQGYEDLLDLPHPVSRVRAQMPRAERAAQFSPFAALSGYEALLEQTERQFREDGTQQKTENLCPRPGKQNKGLE